MNNELSRWYRVHLKTNPWITYACIILCVIVFMLELPGLSSGYNRILWLLGTNGILVRQGQWWRLFTSAFVHLSWWHIGMNMYALYVLGVQMEERMGHGRFAFLLFLSILMGNLSVCLFSPSSLAAGMSTGLYGLMCYDIVRLIRRYGTRAVLNDSGIRYTIIVNLIMNFLPGISWEGHLGGAFAGIVLAFLYR